MIKNEKIETNLLRRRVSARHLTMAFLFCVFGFGAVLAVATDFFTSMVQETNFGNSNCFAFLLLGFALLGFLSLLLAGVVAFFDIIRSEKTKNIIKSPVFIVIVFIFTFATVAFGAKIMTSSVKNVKPVSVTQPFLINTITPIPTTTATPTPKPRRLDGGRLFNLVNDYRKKNGLSELIWYHPLCEFAKARSQQIKENWSHEGYLKEATEGALYNSICPECGRTGENLAKDYHSEEAALQGWIKSPAHKENLDADWDWGCAMYYSNNYVSIIFGKKK